MNLPPGLESGILAARNTLEAVRQIRKHFVRSLIVAFATGWKASGFGRK
jgi:hypothetical protein